MFDPVILMWVPIAIIALLVSIWHIFNVRRALKKLESLGTLRIVIEPGEDPYLFLELNKNVDEILKRDVICFDVDLTKVSQ